MTDYQILHFAIMSLVVVLLSSETWRNWVNDFYAMIQKRILGEE